MRPPTCSWASPSPLWRKAKCRRYRGPYSSISLRCCCRVYVSLSGNAGLGTGDRRSAAAYPFRSRDPWRAPEGRRWRVHRPRNVAGGALRPCRRRPRPRRLSSPSRLIGRKVLGGLRDKVSLHPDHVRAARRFGSSIITGRCRRAARGGRALHFAKLLLVSARRCPSRRTGTSWRCGGTWLATSAMAPSMFATLKAWMGATHFLTRTLDKVRTEMSLHVLAYNLKRMITIFGVGPLMAT